MVKHWVSPWANAWAKMLVTIGLAILLTACGSNLPGNQVIGQAIAMQVAQVQTGISRQLKLKAPTLKDIGIRHLQIEEQSNLKIDQEPGYHLTGRYDLDLNQSDHQATQTDDRFDLYLQKHTEGTGKSQKQVWRLATPQGSGWDVKSIAAK